jgi:hypothetical protein
MYSANFTLSVLGIFGFDLAQVVKDLCVAFADYCSVAQKQDELILR